MTDSKMLEELKDDFKTVTASVNGLSGEISGLTMSVKNIEKTLDKHDERITEAREGQLLATAGIGVLDREMRDVKKAHGPLTFEDKTNGTMVKKLFSKYWRHAAIALLFIGFYLGSRGDTEGMARLVASVQEIGFEVSEIKKIKTEPVRVPVPVTASDLYLEEMAP